MKASLSKKAVAINRISQNPVTIDECKVAFKKGFEDALQIELVEFTLTKEQEKYVKELEKKRYANDEWNYKK